jgi:hypothetical protein
MHEGLGRHSRHELITQGLERGDRREGSSGRWGRGRREMDLKCRPHMLAYHLSILAQVYTCLDWDLTKIMDLNRRFASLGTEMT